MFAKQNGENQQANQTPIANYCSNIYKLERRINVTKPSQPRIKQMSER